jgi:DNA-binding transcriptional ArsR family regulator
MEGMQDAALWAVASPRRRAILRLVWGRELCSGEIASRFDVTWAAISQNLRILENAGLVLARRDGVSRFYRADPTRLGPLASVLTEMWAGDLDRLSTLAERAYQEGTER